jgi:hypothetical protein
MDIDKFKKVLLDFAGDIDSTFPELNIMDSHPFCNLDCSDNNITCILEHCKSIYPQHFFDILYQNENIYKEPIFLLPGIDFSLLWKSEISSNTKNIIWKYLQLILFIVIRDVNDPDVFGDTSKLFEALDENTLKEKLTETFEGFQHMFNSDNASDLSNNPFFNADDLSNNPFFNASDLSNNPFGSFFSDLSNNFNPADMHSHISKLMKGTIGKLAEEIAKESLDDLGIDINSSDNSTTSADMLFKSLLKDPSKLMNIMNKIGNKLEGKVKSGEIDKDELISEASELLKNMKNMPGMENMMKKMAKQHGGKNAKVPSMDAMEVAIQNNLKASKQRSKMLETMNERKLLKQSITTCPDNNNSNPNSVSDEQLIAEFSNNNNSISTKRKKKKKKH